MADRNIDAFAARLGDPQLGACLAGVENILRLT